MTDWRAPALDRSANIPGWFSRAEGEALMTVAEYAIARAGEDGTRIVEVGSYLGRSTVLLHAVIEANPYSDTLLFCVDPHDGLLVAGEEAKGSTWDAFVANIEAAGGFNHVVPLRCASTDVGLDEVAPIHFLFLDALHDYESVKADFAHFEPALATDAVVAFHDYTPVWPGTVQAVDEIIDAGGWRDCGRAGSLKVIQRFPVEGHLLDVTPPPPRICLAMIVRNEADRIAEMLRAAAPHMVGAAIVDTGSTDDTIAVIKATCEELLLPLVLQEHPWVDFGTNRNQALELARLIDCDFIWMMDADDLLVGEPDFTPGLDGDGYLIRYGNPAGFNYQRVQVFRADLPFRYVYPTHEVLVCDAAWTQGTIEGCFIGTLRDAANPTRGDTANKFERDIPLLRDYLRTHPGDARALFYLAESYVGARKLSMAYDTHSKRVAIDDGWDQERFFSMLQLARCAEWMQRAHPDPVVLYLRAWQFRPTRCEPLVELARIHRERGEHHLALLFARQASMTPMPADTLFVEGSYYQWRARDEYALAAFMAHGDVVTAIALTEGFLPLVPDDHRARVEANLGFYRAAQGTLVQ